MTGRSATLGALCAVAFFGALTWNSPASADALDPLTVDFFFDLVDDDFAESRANRAYGASAAGTMELGGIPVRIDAREGSEELQRHTVAGANARYDMTVGDRLALSGSARVARTDFIDERAPSRAFASTSADLRYAHEAWTLGFRQGFEVVREETGFAWQDSVMEGRASRALADRFSVSTIARYRWRKAMSGADVDREFASARIGLACRLSDEARMDVAYVGRREVAAVGLHDGQPATIRSAGPSVAVALPLDRSVDLSANYDYTETISYDAAGAEAYGGAQDLHRLGVALIWDLGGDPDQMQLSAGYTYERFRAAGVRAQARHAGTVSFALMF